MKKAALHNLGCKVNAYETEAMRQMLEKAGYQIVPFTDHADVYVINTCSVTNIADRKSRQMLHRAKKENPASIVVAAGCYVQTSPEAAKADEAIDIIIGNDRKHELIQLIEEYDGLREKRVLTELCDINEPGRTYETLSLERTAEHTRAFLKVQDGCNQFCSYCVIPYARGRVRSRLSEEVAGEVKRLAANGCREVVLTGIHLSSYGTDHGETLLDLIRRVHEVQGIRRIRLGSLEPGIITEEFVGALAGMEKVCPHFHLSLQSGCDETLRRMNRRYDTAQYEKKCSLIRSYYEHPAITTDVIVGFPGETEEEFERTKEFLQRIQFYEMHIFPYSPRKGTRAAVMEGQIPESVKKTRSESLLKLAKDMSQVFRSYYIGKEEEVLLEEKVQIGAEEYYTGYTREYVRVAVQSEQTAENQLRCGIITGQLTEGVYRMQNDFA
ncbi:MAG: tRNA (N(6)-L-threonylcarbamoyladenosine(37)-C(2))-methylthiotransferase MtaB [Lachnospiraceae bacterium]|nr:tRNA (N(6)-L-threonylcarbamoyladenosine(37)-C(2))-methylthiotransferase MtaB [Lachnospiraceae bacterium]